MGSQDEHDREFGQQRDHEPRGLERRLVRMEHEQQDGEGQQVEDRADQAEDDHELLDVPDVPALRPFDPLRIDIVAGDRDRGHVGEEVVQQDLLGRQRQERQQRRRQRHADHVAEVRAGGDRDVFQRVGEGPPAVLDAGAQHVQVAAQQDDVGALAGDIHGLLDGDADVGRMQGRRIVDAVAEIADGVAGPLQGADDPLLLLRVDLDEEIGPRREVPQRLVLERRELFAGEHRLGVEADGLRQMRRHVAIVAADHLDADAEPVEVVDRALRIRLGRVVEDEKAAKGHVPFVVAVVVRLHGHPARGHGQNTEAFGALGLEDRLELRAPSGIERNLDAVALEARADVEHVRERALGDDQVLPGAASSATTMVSRRRRKS